VSREPNDDIQLCVSAPRSDVSLDLCRGRPCNERDAYRREDHAIGGGTRKVVLLGLSKILENMEIGHNVIHGQYDWINDPVLNSACYEWDIVCPAEHWKRTHNYEHHTFTNILGKDRDVGYGFLRVAEDQPWRPRHLAQPLYALGLMFVFEWGIALHTSSSSVCWRAKSPRA
jgi:fatty acid desaturase